MAVDLPATTRAALAGGKDAGPVPAELSRVVALLALVFGVSCALDAGRAPFDQRWALATCSGAVSATLAVLAICNHRRLIRVAVQPHVIGLVAVLSAGDVLAHVLISGNPLLAAYLILTAVATGAFVPSLAWVLAVHVVCGVGFAAGAVVYSEEGASLRRIDGQGLRAGGWADLGVAVGFAIVAAHVLHVLQTRNRARVRALTGQLADQALRDPLTGLLNRRGLAIAAAQLEEDATSGDVTADGAGEGDEHLGSSAEARPTAVLGAIVIDLNGFKAINDQLGHSGGDAVLVEVAERLRALLRADDVLARLGGDEFAVVLGAAHPELVTQLAHRVRIRLSGTAGVLELPWSVSVGTATAACAAQVDTEALLRRADLAMYDEKHARRRAAGAAPATVGRAGPPAL